MTELADRLSRHADLHEHQPWADDEQMQFARDLREAVGLIAELARLRAQEPVAWHDDEWDCAYTAVELDGGTAEGLTPLYRAAPPAQPAEPAQLTETEIFKAYTTATGKVLPNMGRSRAELVAITRIIERAHGITGAKK